MKKIVPVYSILKPFCTYKTKSICAVVSSKQMGSTETFCPLGQNLVRG